MLTKTPFDPALFLAGTEARGVLCAQHLSHLILDGSITASDPVGLDQIQPTSLDLRLGRAEIAVMLASFLPTYLGVEEAVRRLGASLAPSWAEPVTLLPGQVLLVKLAEKLRLPSGVRGRCNAKSTAGRVGLFVRVIADGSETYDEIPSGYEGPLWAQITSLCFPIILSPGDLLTQVRLFVGKTELSNREVMDLVAKRGPIVHSTPPLVPLSPVVAALTAIAGPAAGLTQRLIDLRQGAADLRFSADLAPARQVVAFHHIPTAIRPIDYRAEGTLDPRRYWAPLRSERGGLLLHHGALHLLASREAVSIPPEVCGEMVAIDPGVGEFRAHYAGFFDAGFGFGSPSRIVMEMVPYGLPVFVHDGQPLFRFVLHQNLAKPAFSYGSQQARSHYQGQDLRLSRQFRAWA